MVTDGLDKRHGDRPDPVSCPDFQDGGQVLAVDQVITVKASFLGHGWDLVCEWLCVRIWSKVMVEKKSTLRCF